MARNYLQAGLYREMFREKGVRLICVNDGTDTANGEDELAPFREITDKSGGFTALVVKVKGATEWQYQSTVVI